MQVDLEAVNMAASQAAADTAMLRASSLVTRSSRGRMLPSSSVPDLALVRLFCSRPWGAGCSGPMSDSRVQGGCGAASRAALAWFGNNGSHEPCRLHALMQQCCGWQLAQRAQSADLGLQLGEDGHQATPLSSHRGRSTRAGNSPADAGRGPLMQAPLQHASDSASSGFFAGDLPHDAQMTLCEMAPSLVAAGRCVLWHEELCGHDMPA